MVLPEVVTKIVFGYSAPAFFAASWNSKPWPKARLESLRAVGAESFLELRRGLRLLMRDLGAEIALDALHALPGDGVPAGVLNRAGREQADFECRRWCGGGGDGFGGFPPRLTCGEKEKGNGDHGTFHGADFTGGQSVGASDTRKSCD